MPISGISRPKFPLNECDECECKKGNELVNSQLPAATDLLSIKDLCRTLFDQIMKIIEIELTE